MARPEDRDGPPVERRDPPHTQALGGGYQECVGQSRPMLGGLLQQLPRPNEVRFRRGHEPDRAGDDRLDDGQCRRQAELALEDVVELRQAERP